MWKFIVVMTLLIMSSVTAYDNDQQLNNKNSRRTNTSIKSANQAKRDLSLSYAATDIDSKQGTRVKTVTVIKNIGRNQKLVIDPDLHKDEEWGTVFRDNFDSYAGIPDVPDVDDLFEFVKKKPKMTKTNDVPLVEEKTTQAAIETTMPPATLEEKPVTEESAEIIAEAVAEITTAEPAVEKIKDDAEIIPINSIKHQKAMVTSNVRSQSLSNSIGGRLRMRESHINANNVTNKQSNSEIFDRYVNENNGKGYDYLKPCGQSPSGTITVTTPSGRTYDIALEGNNINSNKGINPYIAPAVNKKPSLSNVGGTGGAGQSGYPVNSLLPPLQQPVLIPSNGQRPRTQNNNNNNNINNPPNGSGYSTSQRPYIAPIAFNNDGSQTSINPAPPLPPLYKSPGYDGGGGATRFRTNIFGAGSNRPNTARSRGLKY